VILAPIAFSSVVLWVITTYATNVNVVDPPQMLGSERGWCSSLSANMKSTRWLAHSEWGHAVEKGR
jgi:hypothetical protein